MRTLNHMYPLFLHFSVLFVLLPLNVCIFPSIDCQGPLCWCVDPTTGSPVPDSRFYQDPCNLNPTFDPRCEPECHKCGQNEICYRNDIGTTCECKPTFTRINGVCQLGPCQKCIAPTNDSSCPPNIQPQDCDTDGTYLPSRYGTEQNVKFCVDKITGQLTREETDTYSCQDWCYKLKCGENEICSPTNPEGTAGECICIPGFVRSKKKCVPPGFFCNETSGYCWCMSKGQRVKGTKLEYIEGYPNCEAWCLKLKCGVTQKCHKGSKGVKSCVCRKSFRQPDGSCCDTRWYRISDETVCKSCSRKAKTCPKNLKDDDEFAANILCSACPPQDFAPSRGPPSVAPSAGVGGCGLNEVPADCACEKTCTNSKPKCPSPCKPGCVCATGLIRKGNLCVPPALCAQNNPPGC